MTRYAMTCPHCGAQLEIDPEHRQPFCQFCATPLTYDEPAEEQPAAPAKAQSAVYADGADRLYAEAHLIDAIAGHEDAFKNFTRKKYSKYFDTFKADITPTYEAIERCVLADPLHREELLQAFVCRFLDDREAYHKKNKLWKLRKNTLLFGSKLTIAFYLVPAIYSLDLTISRDFVTTLHTEFLKRYPDDSFVPATYENIASGFRSGKLCFITTAVCAFEGKPDDCDELQRFRAFRDGWLSEQPDGAALIGEYYRLAPAVVMTIDLCDDRAAVYGTLRREYLTPCDEAIGRQDYPACKQTYIRMVRDLQKKYGLS